MGGVEVMDDIDVSSPMSIVEMLGSLDEYPLLLTVEEAAPGHHAAVTELLADSLQQWANRHAVDLHAHQATRPAVRQAGIELEL
jgi:hypothetical protein